MSDQRPKHKGSKPVRFNIPLDASDEQLQKLIDEWKRNCKDTHPKLLDDGLGKKANQKAKKIEKRVFGLHYWLTKDCRTND